MEKKKFGVLFKREIKKYMERNITTMSEQANKKKSNKEKIVVIMETMGERRAPEKDEGWKRKKLNKKNDKEHARVNIRRGPRRGGDRR